ncbi:MAG: alanine racemase [Verrucomicrobiales bacterium]|nr:alanine racemase [Verrucomicrobiales bacterium]
MERYDAAAEPVEPAPPRRPLRPAWIEINIRHLRRNFEIVNAFKPRHVQVLAVVKDEGYGHGALTVGRAALDAGAACLGVATLDEALALRENGLDAPILVLGPQQQAELPWCVRHALTCAVQDAAQVKALAHAAARARQRVPVHLKLNTGMNRYGIRWTEALSLVELILAQPSLELQGVFSHFAMSDEADKSFALLQLERFQSVLAQLAARGIHVKYRHLCNSGGLLDLPQAHFDMVRIGLLPLGVYPSRVCRRLPGLETVMTVKARIASIQEIGPGETVGYGLRYTAPNHRRIAVLPVGYGDGFPRVRNQGGALIHGRCAPLVGGVAMDALMVDITDIPEAGLWDEAVLLGRQGDAEITVQDVAQLKNSVSYDVLTGWRARLPRVRVTE